ncbi:MAG: tetratricopeptide repeat protein [Acidobacteriota bacterium]
MSRVTAAAALILLLALTASFCLTQLAEVDLFWHLLTGERILDGHGIPRVDEYTHTSAGRPWVDLHWLFQVLIAAVDRAAGPSGLDLLKILLIVGGVGGALAAALRRSSAGVAAAVGLVAVVAAQERFTLRPEAASLCLLGLLLFCLERRDSSPRILLIVPPLLLVWANLHALYAVGIGVLILTVLGDLLDARRPGPGRSDRGPAPRPIRVAAAAGAALLATLCTPYGLAGWDLPRRLLFERIAAGNLYARRIAEFQAPFGGYGPTASVLAFGLLSAIVLAAAALEWRRVRPSDLLLLGATFLLALLARRNIPLFSLVAVASGSPAVGRLVGRAARAWRGRDLPGGRLRCGSILPGAILIPAILLLTVDVWSNRFYARDGTHRYFGRGESPGLYPRRAADFVRSHGLPGEVLNDMSMGGFLAWRWFPDRRVFIDGRLEVHPASLFADYLALQRDPDAFETAARRYGISTVVWSHRRSPGASRLLRYLATGPGWRPVYVDLSASVFVREEVARSGRGGVAPIDLRDPRLAERVLREVREANRRSRDTDPAPGFLRRLLPLREVPLAEVNAALFFGVVGSVEAAEALFREAIRKAPTSAVLQYDLGIVLEKAGRGADARRAFEAALDLDPGFSAARAALALRLLREGEPQAAIENWKLAERRGALGPASLQARGALLARRGEIDAAIRDYREAVRLEPRRADLRADLALLAHRRGLREQALAQIRAALALETDACAPRVALGRIRADGGDPDGAERAFREAVALDPGCFRARLWLASRLASSGRVEEARRELARAMRSAPDAAPLSAEPAFRILAGRPEFRDLLSAGPGGGVVEQR